MGVLLTILKVVGIIIAALIALFLLILAAVLFVGIKYDVNACFNGDISAKAHVSWLFHIIIISTSFVEKELKFKLRVFGIPIISNDKKEKKKKSKKKKDTDAALKKEKSYSSDNKNHSDEQIEISDEDVNDAVADNIETQRLTKEDLKDSGMKSGTESFEGTDGAWTSAYDADEMKKDVKDSKEIKDKSNTEKPLSGIKSKLEKFNETKDKFSDIINDDGNREFFKKVLNNLKTILKKLLPKKHHFRLKYGSDDPASTGQVTGYVAMAMAAVPVNLDFTPVFDEEILEAEGYIYGKIRVISLVIPLLKIILNKQFKHLRKQLQ